MNEKSIVRSVMIIVDGVPLSHINSKATGL